MILIPSKYYIISVESLNRFTFRKTDLLFCVRNKIGCLRLNFGFDFSLKDRGDRSVNLAVINVFQVGQDGSLCLNTQYISVGSVAAES